MDIIKHHNGHHASAQFLRPQKRLASAIKEAVITERDRQNNMGITDGFDPAAVARAVDQEFDPDARSHPLKTFAAIQYMKCQLADIVNEIDMPKQMSGRHYLVQFSGRSGVVEERIAPLSGLTETGVMMVIENLRKQADVLINEANHIAAWYNKVGALSDDT